MESLHSRESPVRDIRKQGAGELKTLPYAPEFKRQFIAPSGNSAHKHHL